MNLGKVRADSDYFTGKLSEITRQLCFAGIAVIWIFRVGGNESAGIKFSSELLLPLTLFVAALALDLLHYTFSSIIWGAFGRYKEHKGTKVDKEFLAPWWFNWPALICFWLKVLCCVLGYYKILIFLNGKM